MEYSKKVLALEMELCGLVLEVCKKIHSLKNSFSDFKPEISLKMKERNKLKILDIFFSDVEMSVLADANKLSDTIGNSITSKKKPLISTANGVGATEFNSALIFVNSLPGEWQELLKIAFNDKRFDFVFSVLDLIKVNKKEPQHKYIVEKLERDFEKSLNIEEDNHNLNMVNSIQKKSKELMSYEFPVNNLLWDSVSGEDLLIIKEIDENFYQELRREKYPLSSTENGKAGFFAEVCKDKFKERGWENVMETQESL